MPIHHISGSPPYDLREKHTNFIITGDSPSKRLKELLMRICVIGAGYVGLVSAACFSEFGWTVSCVDKDQTRILNLKRGDIPIYEPGLETLVERNVNAGRLSFTQPSSSEFSKADVIFIAVGTPSRRGDGYADLTYIFEAVEDLVEHLVGFTVICTKSTVPVGTGDQIEKRLRMARPNVEISICSNPEFLREGSAIKDFMHPDRVLIGANCSKGAKALKELYRPLALRDAPIVVTDRRSAELSKYAANSFLAMKISFINEIADLCEEVGADVHEVAAAIGRDKRIGNKFLHPGPGFGGSCFPKDVRALIRTARDHGAPLSLIEAVDKINAERKIAMARRVRDALGGDLKGKTIGVLGLTFKPETDDMREAPSLVILPILENGGARLRVYDPHGHAMAKSEGLNGIWCKSAIEVARNADAVIVMTEWNEFRALSLLDLAGIMKGNSLIDLRNVFTPDAARSAGLNYIGIGRPKQVP